LRGSPIFRQTHRSVVVDIVEKICPIWSMINSYPWHIHDISPWNIPVISLLA
jgi:hypothetical protein